MCLLLFFCSFEIKSFSTYLIYHIQPKRKSSVPPSEKEKRDQSALTSVPAQIDEGGVHTLGAYRTLSSFSFASVPPKRF